MACLTRFAIFLQQKHDSTAKTFFTTKGTKEREVFSNNCAPKFKILN